MGSFPWGPHGPESSPYDVRPNPTAPSTFPNIGGGGDYAAPSYGGGAPYGGSSYGGGGVSMTGGGSNPLLSILLSLFMLPFVWMFWICLYPVTAAAGGVAVVFTGAMAIRYLSLQGGEASAVALLIGFAAGYAVIAVMSRIEYRLARNTGYRIGRHVVRLLLMSVLAFPWIEAMSFDAGNSATRYVSAVFSHPDYLLGQMSRPQSMAIIAAVMVFTHFLLWKTERLRAFWHRRLMWIGLK
ncbi:MAG: hypothetical protein ACRD3E_14320 [Terriglobales bacterium]